MPELVEVKIMSEFINQAVEGKTFVNVRKSNVSKIKTDLKGSWSVGFSLSAQSRGKELKLEFSWKPECFKDHLEPIRNLICNMGMSGNWSFTETDKIPKHAHLMFDTNDGWTLSLVDVRRFARWQWTNGWSEKRGPDPVNELETFITNVIENLNKKEFDKPIYEVMMNQTYFNGIGNYLRAEILYRIDLNPFLSAREYITKTPDFFNLCRLIPLEVYGLGGGQLKDWSNPFEIDKQSFTNWQQCYGKKEMSNLIDKKKRKYWFNPKYNISL